MSLIDQIQISYGEEYMQVIEYHQSGRVQQRSLPIPEVHDNDILVKVAYSGICGTDLHIIAGEAPAADKVVLGHEFSGTVTDTGSHVSKIKAGNRVAIDPNNYCGECYYCLKGQVHFCQNIHPIGIRHNGGWAEYCVVPESQVFFLSEDTDIAWGALAEPLSCIVHGWDRIQPLNKEDSVLLLGAGIIGILWRLVLKNAGKKNVLISEPNTSRREIVKKLGFEAVTPRDLAKQSGGFDVIIDCSGNITAIEKCIGKLNPLGRFLFFGITPQHARISIKPFNIFEKELTFLGSVINPGTFKRALKVMNEIQIPLDSLGIAFFSLDEYNTALEAARTGKATKVMFEPGQE